MLNCCFLDLSGNLGNHLQLVGFTYDASDHKNIGLVLYGSYREVMQIVSVLDKAKQACHYEDSGH